MRIVPLALLLLAGCATGESHTATDRRARDGGRGLDAGDAERDAGMPAPDAGGGGGDGGAGDAGMPGVDAGTPRDAGRTRDSGPRCMCEAAACATACGSTGTTSCVDPCAPVCSPPGESCNVRDDDCDGACDEDGCRSGVHRSVNAASGEHFYTRDRAEAACCGFRVETYDYFWIYPDPQPGLVPLYRCLLASGYHFYTTAGSCEGSAGAIGEGVLGYVAGAETCGSIPLYRLWHATAGHFYTTSSGERDGAVATGYVSEGIAAHVWSTR